MVVPRGVRWRRLYGSSGGRVETGEGCGCPLVPCVSCCRGSVPLAWAACPWPRERFQRAAADKITGPGKQLLQTVGPKGPTKSRVGGETVLKQTQISILSWIAPALSPALFPAVCYDPLGILSFWPLDFVVGPCRLQKRFCRRAVLILSGALFGF